MDHEPNYDDAKMVRLDKYGPLLTYIKADAGYVEDECTTDDCKIERRHYAHDGLPVTVDRTVVADD